MMVRTIVLTTVLALSAAPAFACKNAMQPEEQEAPTRKAPEADARGPITAQRAAPQKKAPRTNAPRTNAPRTNAPRKSAPAAPEEQPQVAAQPPSTSPDYALLGLAGIGLAGLTGAFVLRSRS